ncbi:MAG: Gmad2 immunoglobulin-like domain-containing protein [bacterium]|nr:Gmad2 immunoglobulin-like domain-containing protein [bacterium]
MRKFIYLIIGVVIIFFAAKDGLQYWQAYMTQDAAPTPTPTPTLDAIVGTPEPVANNNIIVASPAKDASVSLPFTITGSARVFENTVSFSIKDAETGNEIYRNFTTANAADMGQFGPYTHTVTYMDAKPVSDQIVLEVFWDSPEDGRPLDVVAIPLVFNRADIRSVDIYFTNDRLDPEVTCVKVFSTERVIARTAAPASAAIELLLKGPTAGERERHYATQIPEGIKLPRLSIAQGTATIDFNADIEAGMAGSCRVQAVRAQIERTLYQFANISGVVISVEGRTEDILQP